MPKYSKRRYPKSYPKSKATKKNNFLKKATGGTPNTLIEKISHYGGKIGAVAGTVARIMTLINTEQKYYENTQTYQNVTNGAGGYILYLNNLSQGNGENDRNGEKVVNKNITLNYCAKVNASASASNIRIIVVYDKKPEIGQTTTVYTDVMNNVSPLAQVNKDNGDRFVILASRLISLSPLATPVVNGKIYCKLEKVHTDWNSSTATDWEKGAIKLFAVSDEATNYPTMEVRSRINFYDN